MKYIYPAIFTKEDEGGYSINFPDIPSCYTQGEDVQDGMEMAEDVLALMLFQMEKAGEEAPLPTDVKEVPVREEQFVSLVMCDTVEYQKMHSNRAVKKTLTIPEWLNEEALRANLNFSQVLQEALQIRLSKL